MWQKHCDQLKERQDDMFKYLFYIFIIATSISAQTYTLDPSRDSLITYCLYETNTRTTFTNNLTQAYQKLQTSIDDLNATSKYGNKTRDEMKKDFS